MDNKRNGVKQQHGVNNQPNANKHIYVLRIWRRNATDCWHYTIVTPNVEKKHHFLSLADAMAFVDPKTEITA